VADLHRGLESCERREGVQVADLSRSFGFETIVGGALSNARYLEPMAEFMIQLGHGDAVGFGLLRAD
jgi:predicted dinucleotide-binding enzyme